MFAPLSPEPALRDPNNGFTYNGSAGLHTTALYRAAHYTPRGENPSFRLQWPPYPRQCDKVP